MKLHVLVRAAQILRAQPAYSLSLVRLHARLSDELGAQAGSYAALHAELKKRPESFVVIDSPRVLAEGAGRWPKQLREQYDDAFSGAGLGACVRVSLAEPPNENPDADALRLAGRTVSELWSAASSDAMLCDYLTRASQQLEEISSLLSPDAVAELPTTHPHDPRREP